MKQAIIIRKDIKMSTGKIAAQASHASLGAYKKASYLTKKQWELTGQKKIVLKTDNLQTLRDLFMTAKTQKLPVALIKDAGKTQIPEGTTTCLGIGPADDNKIDSVTKHLKLY